MSPPKVRENLSKRFRILCEQILEPSLFVSCKVGFQRLPGLGPGWIDVFIGLSVFQVVFEPCRQGPAKPYYSSTMPGPLYRAHCAVRVTELYQLSVVEGVYNQNAVIMSHPWRPDLAFAHAWHSFSRVKGLSVRGREAQPPSR